MGYSDHTQGIEVAIAAVAMGATVIEKHFTLDRNLPGPDHQASLEPAELKAMVAAIRNIELALGYGVPHVSSYALTVEPKTALASFIKKGVIDDVDDEQAHEQFHILKDKLEASGFVHYELSNFGKEGFFSKNNSAYWQGKSYIGIGPSAHSFNGKQRGWNVSNNSKYIQRYLL